MSAAASPGGTLPHGLPAAPDDRPPSRGDDDVVAREVIADCDAKLATQRAALKAGADPTLVTQWVAETQARRARAEAELRTSSKGVGTRLSRDEIPRLVRSIKDLAAVVRQVEPQDKARTYRQFGVRLTYDSGKHKVLTEMRLDQHSHEARGLSKCPRGDLNPHAR